MALRLDALRRHTPHDAIRAADDGAHADGTDRLLVAEAKRERAAFAALYDRYLDPVYRFCPARLGNREAAEDATSVVFTKALRGIGTRRDDAVRAWLVAIAHNVDTGYESIISHTGMPALVRQVWPNAGPGR